MKKTLSISLLIASMQGFCQVGINTDSPRPGVALDVQGTFKAKSLIAPSFPPVSVSDRDSFLYLVQDPSDHSVSMLDLTATGSNGSGGISTLLTFKLTNVNGDWVQNFNTRIDANQYALVVLSAWFDQSLVGTKPALPIAGTKEVDGVWYLEADYSAIKSNTNGTWYIQCVAYPKTYAKIFPQQHVVINSSSSGNNTTGAATTSIFD